MLLEQGIVLPASPCSAFQQVVEHLLAAAELQAHWDLDRAEATVASAACNNSSSRRMATVQLRGL